MSLLLNIFVVSLTLLDPNDCSSLQGECVADMDVLIATAAQYSSAGRMAPVPTAKYDAYAYQDDNHSLP